MRSTFLRELSKATWIGRLFGHRVTPVALFARDAAMRYRNVYADEEDPGGPRGKAGAGEIES